MSPPLTQVADMITNDLLGRNVTMPVALRRARVLLRPFLSSRLLRSSIPDPFRFPEECLQS